MEWVKAINNAIEYMENHLTENITLNDIAESVYISAFHFQRAFSMMTGVTPTEYLRNRRLSQAGAELANGDESVINIALKYGYDSPESFTKAFSRFHGFTPTQVKKGSPIKFMNRYTIRITIEGGSIMEYQIEKWEAMDLLVHMKDFHVETSEKEIPLFWDAYFENEQYSKVPGYLGVCAQKKTGGEVFQFGIGCRASDVEGVPEDFEVIHIPEYSWAVFRCVGSASESIQALWDKLYNEWLPVAEYELIPDYYIENYLPGNPMAPDYVCEVCIPVKK